MFILFTELLQVVYKYRSRSNRGWGFVGNILF